MKFYYPIHCSISVNSINLYLIDNFSFKISYDNRFSKVKDFAGGKI